VVNIIKSNSNGIRTILEYFKLRQTKYQKELFQENKLKSISKYYPNFLNISIDKIFWKIFIVIGEQLKTQYTMVV